MRASLLGLAMVMALASSARADSKLYFASLNFESPVLVVPVLLVTLGNDADREWTLGLIGWTLSGDWRRPTSTTRKRHLFVRVTPINAHSANYIYVNGERDEAAQFQASSIELGAGQEIVHRRGWTGGYRVLATYDAVSGLADQAVADFWARPYVGIEVTQQYSRVTSDERLGSRWDGVKIDASARVLTGTHTWTRARVRARAGKRVGRLFATGEVSAFGGSQLNTVSDVLVGGSWDLSAPDLLVGYRYGEFRVNRGALAGAGVDVRLRGAWQVGTRVGYLAAPGTHPYGAALQLSTVWRGLVLNAGVALPREGLRDREWDRAVAFATVTAAVLRH